MKKNHPQAGFRIDGLAQATQILRGLDEAHRNRMLSEIQQKDPALYSQLQERMRRLEDLISLTPEDFRKVMAMLPRDCLVLAMKRLSPEFEAHLKSMLTTRAWEELTQEVSALGLRKVSDIQSAHRKWIELAENCAAQNQITWSR